MPNLKRLGQPGPVLLIVLGELDLDRPTLRRGLLQKRSFLFEGMALDVERVMVGQHGQQLPGLYLLAEIDFEFLHLVGHPFDAIVDQWRCGLFDFRSALHGGD